MLEFWKRTLNFEVATWIKILTNPLGAYNGEVGCSINGGSYLGREYCVLEEGDLTLRDSNHVICSLDVGHLRILALRSIIH